MPCCFRSDRRPPADPSVRGCQFSVPDSGLIEFDGETWCPFHLPFSRNGADSGKRDWDDDAVAAFLEALTAFIRMAAAAGGPVDLTGVRFPGATSFEAFAAPTPGLPAVLFDGAVFAGDADFIEVRFSGPVSFAGAVFEGDADFIVADFQDSALFRDATVRGGFDASEARFRGTADFTGCAFAGPVHFRETQFAAPPRLDGATFAEAPAADHVRLPDGAADPFPR